MLCSGCVYLAFHILSFLSENDLLELCAGARFDSIYDNTVFSSVILCLSTIVTYHVKKCASVAVIVYLISKTLWSYKILNTHYHRHIMQIIANYTDLCQITATIRKKILLTIQPEILLFLSSLSCSLRITRSLIFISLNTDFKQRKQTSRLYHWSIIKYQTCILLWLVR